MDNNIVQTVFDTLSARTDEISKTVAERDTLEKEINSGRYSAQTLKEEMYPKRDALRRKVQDDSFRTIQDAKNLVEQYRQDVEKLNVLDPSALTDDVKLLQSGIVLTSRDIQGMIERNKDNRTMLQIILRYAKEHNINTRGTLYVGGEAEEQIAKGLDTILLYYKNWIDKPNAKEMLTKFFNL